MNSDLQFLDLPLIAARFAVDYHEQTGLHWFNGGSLTFAQGLKRAYPSGLTVHNLTSSSGVFEHAVVKINGLDVYGDPDGWFTLAALKSKMHRRTNRIFNSIDVFNRDSVSNECELPVATCVAQISAGVREIYSCSQTIPGTDLTANWINGDANSLSITHNGPENDENTVLAKFLSNVVSIDLSKGIDVLAAPYFSSLGAAYRGLRPGFVG